MPGIIDADTHLFEPPQAWDHFDYRFYCSYEEWEDLPYLLRHAGEDSLLVGSDWGHHGGRGRGGDPSGQPEVFSNMRARGDVTPRVVEKLLVVNPRRFYGIS